MPEYFMRSITMGTLLIAACNNTKPTQTNRNTIDRNRIVYDPTILEFNEAVMPPPDRLRLPASAARTRVVAAAAEPEVRIHVIQPKDTLYSLARRYYGDAGKWKSIYEANEQRIKNPDALSVGIKLIIP